MKYSVLYVIQMFVFLFGNRAESQITRIWLTHQSNDPSGIVVNWHSKLPGNSEVYFRTGTGEETRILKKGSSILHHVTIPLEQQDVLYHYRVKTGSEVSATYTFKGYPSDKNELRVAVVGNWGYAEGPDFSRLVIDDPHLLLTVGDNVPNLHQLCGEGVKDCVEPFLRLIDSEQKLFQTTPFMPVLGNHDKEIRPRGNKYPPVAVYDTNATAYTRFFELPDDEWKWKFEIPGFDLSFVALDLNHITDFGTTWQTCHDFHIGSEQFNWYQEVMENAKGITITLLNEQNQRTRNLENGQWKSILEKGTAVISGYGYFSERAQADEFLYFTTSLPSGDKYPDTFSKFLRSVGGYMLLTFLKNKQPRFEMKTLDGNVMDTSFGSGKN